MPPHAAKQQTPRYTSPVSNSSRATGGYQVCSCRQSKFRLEKQHVWPHRSNLADLHEVIYCPITCCCSETSVGEKWKYKTFGTGHICRRNCVVFHFVNQPYCRAISFRLLSEKHAAVLWGKAMASEPSFSISFLGHSITQIVKRKVTQFCTGAFR